MFGKLHPAGVLGGVVSKVNGAVEMQRKDLRGLMRDVST